MEVTLSFVATALCACLALVLLTLAAAGSPTLRRDLQRPRVLAGLLLVTVLLNAASAWVARSGASGTGTRTDRGWPKAYHFRWESWETAEQHEGLNWLFFAGNGLVWGSVALVAWIAWRLISLRSRAGRPPDRD